MEVTTDQLAEFIQKRRAWIVDDMSIDFLRWALAHNPPDRSGAPISISAGDIGLHIAWEAWRCSRARERASAISMAEATVLDLEGDNANLDRQAGARDVVRALKGEIP